MQAGAVMLAVGLNNPSSSLTASQKIFIVLVLVGSFLTYATVISSVGSLV